MTLEDAIKQLQYRIDTASQVIGRGKDGKAYEDIELAISALKTIGQFKWERDIAIEQLEELGLGLGQKVDHVKEALEKQNPKKPIEQIKLIGLDKGGKCPTCHKYVNNNQHWMYCECGQKLDWSE